MSMNGGIEGSKDGFVNQPSDNDFLSNQVILIRRRFRSFISVLPQPAISI